MHARQADARTVLVARQRHEDLLLAVGALRERLAQLVPVREAVEPATVVQRRHVVCAFVHERRNLFARLSARLRSERAAYMLRLKAAFLIPFFVDVALLIVLTKSLAA